MLHDNKLNLIARKVSRPTKAITQFLNRAEAAGYKVKGIANSGFQVYRSDRWGHITMGVWIVLTGRGRFDSATRMDVDLTITTTIRTLGECSRLLGLE
jgi:hypothetical protein